MMKGCAVAGCYKPHKAKGYCSVHYDVFLRYGDPLAKISPWTQEVLASVAGMLLEKLPASQIVIRLAPHVTVTRNAVIGIVHRNKTLRDIGFKSQSRASVKKSRMPGVLATLKPSRFVKPYRQPRTPTPAYLLPKEFLQHIGDHIPDRAIMLTYPPKPPTRLLAPVLEPRSIPLMDLKRGDCKWAVNDAPPKGTHLFCGNPAECDKPYCAGHAVLSYQSRDRRQAAAGE